MKFLSKARDAHLETQPVQEAHSWTEEVLIVEQANFLAEQSQEGKQLLSIRLELIGDPQSSSNTRKRPEIQLVFGIEEKDAQTLLRLLGRKVYLQQQREVTFLEREALLEQIEILKEELHVSHGKVKYLNDSLHHYVEGSRKSPGV